MCEISRRNFFRKSALGGMLVMVPTLSHFDQVQASAFHKPADINNLTDIEIFDYLKE